jgi:plasmid stabilization system protein ParE
MAEIVWTEPALSDLDAIADYISLDDQAAAKRLVQRIFGHMDLLAEHPKMGSNPPELKGSRYRQSIEPPCRAFYRQEGTVVYVMHVMRQERLLSRRLLRSRAAKVAAPGTCGT